MPNIVSVKPPILTTSPTPNLPLIDTTLSQANDLVTQLKGQVDDCINQCLANAANTLGSTCGCVTGCFDNTLAKAEQLLNALGLKVDGYLQNIFANAYTLALQANCQVPSPQDIILQTPAGIAPPPAPPQPPSTGQVLPPSGPIGGGSGGVDVMPPSGSGTTECPNPPCTVFGGGCDSIGLCDGNTILGCQYNLWYAFNPQGFGSGPQLDYQFIDPAYIPASVPPYQKCWVLFANPSNLNPHDLLTSLKSQINPVANCYTTSTVLASSGETSAITCPVTTTGSGSDTCCPPAQLTCPTPTITVNVPPCPGAGGGSDTTQLSDWPDWPQEFQPPPIDTGSAGAALSAVGPRPWPPRPVGVLNPLSAPSEFNTYNGSWSEVIDNLTRTFAQIGQSVLTGNVPNPTIISDLQSILHGLPVSMAKSFGDKISSINDWSLLNQLIGNYEQALQGNDSCDYQTLRQLYACKALFTFLGSLTVGISDSNGLSGNLGTNLTVVQPGVPITSPAGLGLSKNSSNTLSGSWQVVIAPLQSLLDLCIASVCPPNTMGIGQATAAWLANQISDTHFKSIIATSGINVADYGYFVQSSRSRQTDKDWIALYWRGFIDQQALYQGMRQNGWLNADEIDQHLAVQYAIASEGDAVQWQARGVFDASFVNQYSLDAEFDTSYTTEVQSIAQANGVSDDIMKAKWRNHWRNPGQGELQQMLWRLRPDKQDVADQGLGFTADDFTNILAKEAVNPYWRERLKYISYRPVPRLGILRAYAAGSASEQDVLSALQDYGLTPAAAQQMLAVGQRQRAKQILGENEVKLYGKAGLSKATATTELRVKGYTDEEISNALDSENRLHDWEDTAYCMSEIGKRYVSGGIDEGGVRSFAAQYDLDQDQITRLIGRWNCQRQSRDRAAQAGELCTWFREGLIQLPDFSNRLTQMGYRNGDVSNIVSGCVIKQQQATEKAQEKAITQQQRQAQKQQQQLIKAEQQASKTAHQQAKLQSSINKALNKQRDQIAALIQKASLDYGIDIPLVTQTVTQIRAGLIQDTGYTESQANEVLIDALGKIKTKMPLDLATWVNEAIVSRQSFGSILET